MSAATLREEVQEWIHLADGWASWYDSEAEAWGGGPGTKPRRPQSLHAEAERLSKWLWKLLRRWKAVGMAKLVAMDAKSTSHIPVPELMMKLLRAERLLFTDAGRPLFRCMVEASASFTSEERLGAADPKAVGMRERSAAWSREQLQATARGIRRVEASHPLGPHALPQNSASLEFLYAQGFSICDMQRATEDAAADTLIELTANPAVVLPTDSLAERGSALVNAAARQDLRGRLLDAGEALLRQWSATCSSCSNPLPPLSPDAPLSPPSLASLLAVDAPLLALHAASALRVIASRPFLSAPLLSRLLRPFALAAVRAPWVLTALTSPLEASLRAARARDDRPSRALSALLSLLRSAAADAAAEPAVHWWQLHPRGTPPFRRLIAAALLGPCPSPAELRAAIAPFLRPPPSSGTDAAAAHVAPLGELSNPELEQWLASCHVDALLGHSLEALALAEDPATASDAAAFAVWSVQLLRGQGAGAAGRELLALRELLRGEGAADAGGAGCRGGGFEEEVYARWEGGGEVAGRALLAAATCCRLPTPLRARLLRLLQSALPDAAAAAAVDEGEEDLGREGAAGGRRSGLPRLSLPLPVCVERLLDRLQQPVVDSAEAQALLGLARRVARAAHARSGASAASDGDIERFLGQIAAACGSPA